MMNEAKEEKKGGEVTHALAHKEVEELYHRPPSNGICKHNGVG
jgi:hypothetical protein